MSRMESELTVVRRGTEKDNRRGSEGLCYLLRQVAKTMFDHLPSLEKPGEAAREPSAPNDEPAEPRTNYSALLAVVVFCLLYFPIHRRPWGWPLSVAVSWSTVAFGCAFFYGLDYADDFFGDSRVPKYVAKLLLPHLLILIPVTYLAWLWLRATPFLPHWLTVTGRKGSLWELCGILLASYAAFREGVWPAGKIRRHNAEAQE